MTSVHRELGLELAMSIWTTLRSAGWVRVLVTNRKSGGPVMPWSLSRDEAQLEFLLKRLLTRHLPQAPEQSKEPMIAGEKLHICVRTTMMKKIDDGTGCRAIYRSR